jgi:uncharacterized membrane protein (UPF0127 family)
MGQADLEAGRGMVFPGTRGVHTHFMRFPIDVVFYDRAHVVVAVSRVLRPWRFSAYHFRSNGAIELPAGTAQATRTVPGDQLAIEEIAP